MHNIDELLYESLGGFGIFLSILLFILEVFVVIVIYEIIKFAVKRNKISKSKNIFEPFGLKRNEKGYWIGEKMFHYDIVYAYCMDPFGEFGIMIKYQETIKFIPSSLVPTNVVIEKIKEYKEAKED